MWSGGVQCGQVKFSVVRYSTVWSGGVSTSPAPAPPTPPAPATTLLAGLPPRGHGQLPLAHAPPLSSSVILVLKGIYLCTPLQISGKTSHL